MCHRKHGIVHRQDSKFLRDLHPAPHRFLQHCFTNERIIGDDRIRRLRQRTEIIKRLAPFRLTERGFLVNPNGTVRGMENKRIGQSVFPDGFQKKEFPP